MKKKDARYIVYHRTCWRYNPEWPGGKEPHLGKRKFISYAATYEAARDICEVWNKHNDPGPLSDKAEFERL